MRKTVCLCLCLCLLAAAAPVMGEEAVAYVNGEGISAGQLARRMQGAALINAQAAADMTEQEAQAREQAARAAALSALVSETALLQEARARGLTLEDAGLAADAQRRYDAMLASVESYVLASYPTLKGTELDEQVDILIAQSGGSRDGYRQSAEQSALLAALDEALIQDLPGPDAEEVEARYEALYAEQKERFGADQNAFEAAMLQGEIVVHRPRDLKLIQKAEFLFDRDASALIRQTALVDEDLAEEMRLDQYRLLAGEVEETYVALLEGEVAFADVLEARKPGSSGSVNYFNEQSTRFEEAYYTRAAAFEEVGEMSTAYILPNGYAILYYAGDLPAADRVPLAEVEERIAQALVEEGRKESLEQAKEAIVAAADVTYGEEAPR